MRTIIKTQDNLRELVKKHFDNIDGTLDRSTNLTCKQGRRLDLREGKHLGTVYADDRDGVRRQWTVTAFQASGTMQRIHNWGFWALRFISHQTEEEIRVQEEWLQSRGV